MASTVRVTYNRKFTNKLSDGSFESFELGGDAEIEGEFSELEDITGAYDQLYAEFVTNVEAKVLQLSHDLTEKAKAPVKEEPKQDKLTSWVNKTVKEETDAIRSRVLPGEKFTKPPAFGKQQREPEVSVDQIVEGEAVAYENLKVFLDNKQTKIGKTQRGKKFGMLRLGGRGQIPGDYATAKSFDPDVVEAIEAVIDQEIDNVDVYGYWEPRNNDPEVFDIVVQGIQPAGG